jgi:hypothetical protein
MPTLWVMYSPTTFFHLLTYFIAFICLYVLSALVFDLYNFWYFFYSLLSIYQLALLHLKSLVKEFFFYFRLISSHFFRFKFFTLLLIFVFFTIRPWVKVLKITCSLTIIFYMVKSIFLFRFLFSLLSHYLVLSWLYPFLLHGGFRWA